MPYWMLKSDKGISGEKFDMFINICSANSTAISFSKMLYADYDNKPCTVEQLLNPYLITSIESRRWYGYSEIHSQMIQLIYAANDNVKRIILECYDDVFKKKQTETFKGNVCLN